MEKSATEKSSTWYCARCYQRWWCVCPWVSDESNRKNCCVCCCEHMRVLKQFNREMRKKTNKTCKIIWSERRSIINDQEEENKSK